VGVKVDSPLYHSDRVWYRLIPSRFPPVDVYARLDSAELRSAAQEIEARTNPRLISKARAMQGREPNRASSARLQNWNHAPFTYKNPEGTYLLDPNYGVMEVVSDVRSALGYYLRRREIFLSRTSEPPMGLDMRMLQTKIRGDFVNLTSFSPDARREDRWKIGQELYESNAQGVLFQRPGFPGALFLSVFDGSTLEPSVQGAHYRFAWDGDFIKSVYDFSSGEEITREELLPEEATEESVTGGLICDTKDLVAARGMSHRSRCLNLDIGSIQQ